MSVRCSDKVLDLTGNLPPPKGSVETRDYLAAWLGILLKESYIVKVEETRGVEVVQSE